MTQLRANGRLAGNIELDYRNGRNKPKIKIRKSKKEQWRELYRNMENETSGPGYKIVTDKLKRLNTPNELHSVKK